MHITLFPGRSRARGAAMALLLAAALTASAASVAPAQIIRPGPVVREPAVWTSASVGIMQTEVINDYPSGTAWDFGTIFAWRASAEKTISRGNTIGLSGMLSRTGLVTAGGTCPQACEGDANVFQVLALFRAGAGRGLHQVIEIQAGATGFSNFRERTTDARLQPLETVWDPTISIGYGLGYNFSPTLGAQIVQDAGLMLHRTGDNAPANATRSRQWYVTRIGIRYGL